jgi:uncharacterized protein YbcC (UPF0753/DUF2309 family)
VIATTPHHPADDAIPSPTDHDTAGPTAGTTTGALTVEPTTTLEPPPTVLSEPAPATTAERLRAACARVAPVWPLERFVAVNPYLGMTELTFAEAAERLATVAGARATLPLEWYLAAVDEGRIDVEDLEVALRRQQPARTGDGGSPEPAPVDVAGFLARAARHGDEAAWAVRVPTVANVAAAVTGRDWDHLLEDRVTSWAAAHFDTGQALWRSTDGAERPYAAWWDEAGVDRTPEVMGVRGFRAAVRSFPGEPHAAAGAALDELGVPDEACELYLHRLLLRVGGWSAFAARIVWESGLAGRDDDTLVEFLVVQLVWEAALLRCLGGEVAAAWSEATDALRALGDRPEVREAVADRLVLQDAFDVAEQRRLVAAFAARPDAPTATGVRPEAQAVFCIDVRSEVFRRNLEAVGPGVETIGFAGFFGFPVEYLPLAHEHGEAQCPVLLTPSHSVVEAAGDPGRTAGAVEARRLKHQVRRAWKSFKMGAISCFSFVGPVGLAYLPKMFTDAYGWTRPVRRPEDEGLPSWAVERRGPTLDAPAGADGSGIPLADRIALAEGALRAMSLTDGFAPVVLIAGHGASTVNNPYDTGLDCGACGGHTGEANARVAALVLNDPGVRSGLAERGIEVPADTWFVAAQHDTTTDDVTVFDRDGVPATHRAALAELERLLGRAGSAVRAERAVRLGIAPGDDVDDVVRRRATDWAQVRPEWGLAGCRAFVVAPRSRTRALDLGGRSFLHSYDWRADEGFGVLELVMTAPMVVASWISLQYYASTVENRLFGSGNKTLHNVVGRVGVLEGNAGDLRVGLPWQSVHDGERLQHEPVRLNVVVEAPIEAMNDVLARHDGVRDLVDHDWLHLLALDDEGRVSHRYAGDLRWEPVTS